MLFVFAAALLITNIHNQSSCPQELDTIFDFSPINHKNIPKILVKAKEWEEEAGNSGWE
jgi:hypothetical protein